MAPGISHTLLTTLTILSYLLQVTMSAEFDMTIEFPDTDCPSSSTSSVDIYKKRLKNSGGATPSKKRKRVAYRLESDPLKEDLLFVNYKFLASLEENLSYNGYEYPWDLANLSVDRAKHLCIEYYQKRILDITITEDMSADCDISQTIGPTNKKAGLRKYYGFFKHYYPTSTEEPDFYGDLIKCYCAYNQFNRDGILKTVPHSKKNFFLLKRSETLYYILSSVGETQNFALKVIDRLELSNQ